MINRLPSELVSATQLCHVATFSADCYAKGTCAILDKLIEACCLHEHSRPGPDTDGAFPPLNRMLSTHADRMQGIQ